MDADKISVMFLEEGAALAVTASEAEQLAAELYGIAAAATVLPGEYDCNFHLHARDGREFVLKCMHPARQSSFIEMQCAALEHVSACAPLLPLPRVQRNIRGSHFAEITDGEDHKRVVWMLRFLPGATLESTNPHSREILEDLGRFLGQLDAALLTFSHSGVHRELKWDSSRAGWIRAHLNEVQDPDRRALVEYFHSLYEEQVESRHVELRKSAIYGDANDHNVLVSPPWPQPRKIAGLIDFGDMHHGWIVSEPAIATAYAILGKQGPLGVASSIARGFHRTFPLTEAEIAALFPLVGMRLAVSVVNSAVRKKQKPGDPYVTVTEDQAWAALERLAKIHPRFAHYTLRDACGLPAVPKERQVKLWLEERRAEGASVVEADLRIAPLRVLDLSVGSTMLGADPANTEAHILARTIFERMESEHVAIGVGLYNEARSLYTTAQYDGDEAHANERRTIHLGLDLFVIPGTAVCAPLDGTIHLLAENTAELDYGPLVILRHLTGDGEEFFTLYGHLTRETLRELKPGQAITRGEIFARVGTLHENGGWPPHLHFQVILDLLDRGAEFAGVARASERTVWTSLCPDPNLLLGIPSEKVPPAESSAREVQSRRKELLGGNLAVSYRKPLKIVRGWRQYLYDETGRAYLDVYNNVPLVGHSHPRVVKAAQEQLALLNTNTRYLHENILRYTERLTALLPDPLRICYIVNSGSEANELALRLARSHTGCDDTIVLEHAYHGHTNTLIDISPYKFGGPGGSGKKPWVHIAPLADDYRGIYRRAEPDLGAKYAKHAGDICGELQSRGKRPTYIAETLPSVGGQIVFPPGYLAEVYRYVRAAGGVCIADEVQVGFGRLGTHFWGFETQGVIPDIVVFGKPIGNSFPLAAVVATREIADSFNNGMEFFSTFGGNPVSCAAGLAVLDVLRDEGLQENALRIGQLLVRKFHELQRWHPLIGDVRGAGLFLGLDLVLSQTTREPAPNRASYVVNRLREEGILAGTDGPHHNVIKLRPPLIFSESDAEYFCATLGRILREDPAQPDS
ncbi:MAG TPA: aminotransferase class III-fold pyridoxal phosphate-dependent enzyme [Candidatus Acidoferrum sp.]|nr:aminotransferase class III-fold pyridoxal phosphate-dependent enzyme [Candidatus Acidoferrum sp.]